MYLLFLVFNRFYLGNFLGDFLGKPVGTVLSGENRPHWFLCNLFKLLLITNLEDVELKRVAVFILCPKDRVV